MRKSVRKLGDFGILAAFMTHPMSIIHIAPFASDSCPYDLFPTSAKTLEMLAFRRPIGVFPMGSVML
jgi:hypothetical protein